MLFLCNEYKNEEINLYVTYSEEYKSFISPACLNEHELEKLSKLEHKLSKEEITNYSKIWQELVNINSPLRVIEKGKILSVNFDYFDNLILDTLKDSGRITIASLIGTLISKNHIRDIEYLYFVDKLIRKNKILIVEENKERHFLDIIKINI